MKAIVFKKFGPSSVLEFVDDWPVPEPKQGEVLIKQKATGVNPIDPALRTGGGLMGLFTKLPKVPGGDVCGTIDKFGPNTESAFAVGDTVFALSDGWGPVNPVGTYAEYTIAKASDLAKVPAGLGLAEASGVPLPALTAWQALEKANLQSGQRIFITTGAGGVGGHAIQLAKARGLHVTTSCSSRSADYVKQLGADEVFDYTQGKSIAKTFKGRPFDAIIDSRGGKEQYDQRKVLKKGGTFVAILNPGYYRDYGYPGRALEIFNLIQWKARHSLGLGPATEAVMVAPNGEQIAVIAELFESGKIKPLPTEVLPLKDAA
ncbi:hypothetical protein QBZ16_001539 [Prototheca wickerhamii]|uniref:Enoyl reductase (ER) domain-containing protein n=1 Tax=Prototheca wickerhamii TaxID=3111 RepID=A0AAD9MK64_PROWI|nr:hypothetical protein QBZ16_001539 [Prototheca wickerhamii]